MRAIRRFLRAIALIVACGLTVPVAVVTVIMGSLLFLPLPAVLPAPKAISQSQGSKVHTVDGREIAEFKDVDLKIPVRPEDIPEVLKKAVISAEDRNFYQHGGVDVRGSFRAFWTDVNGGKVTQGGSTITQQYVKKTYTDEKRNLVRKVREAVLASQLERSIPKEEILFKYLSIVYFGGQAYGAGAAAQTYFRKPVSQLTLSEAAMMAGVIPAPSKWAPRVNMVEAEFHRQLVLKGMLEQGVVTQQEYDTALNSHLVAASAGDPPPGSTVVYPPEQTAVQYPDFVDYVQRYLFNKYGENTVLRGGLDVTVTLDTTMQDLALKSVRGMMKGTPEDLEMSLVSVEPETGYVKAMVGGRSFGSGKYESTNFALGGCPPKPAADVKVVVTAKCWDGTTITGGGGGRQAGSSFKAFTLAAAFQKGIPPSKTYPALRVYQIPRTLCKPVKNAADCQIRNAGDGEGNGQLMNLKQATGASVNTVFAQLINDVGIKDTAEMAKKLGISSNSYIPKVHGLSYTLGVEPVSPLDMASAYGVFDNHGRRAEPIPVLTVKDSTGKVLEDNSKPATSQVIAANVADNVTDLLRAPVAPGGTAYPRADIGRPAAGKTGTTEDNVDAWFVGFTPTVSTSVWMGYAANEKTKMRNIKGVREVFGGTLPAQVWHDFMKPALAKVAVTNFDQPAPIVPLKRDLNKEARGGLDPGDRRGIADTPLGGPYVVAPGEPTAVAPTTSTSAPPPVESTTTTTAPAAAKPPGSTTTTLVPRP